MLDNHHELYVLVNLIDWDVFEKAFAPPFHEDNYRPAKPIRLMTGLIILKHLRKVSDETVAEQFKENATTSISMGRRHSRQPRHALQANVAGFGPFSEHTSRLLTLFGSRHRVRWDFLRLD